MENNEEKEQRKEQSIEEAALQKYPLKSPTDRGHTMNWDYECHNKNMRQAFIAGANHDLSSKGLVEREAVIELLRNRISQYELERAEDILSKTGIINNGIRISLLTDLINKIKEI